MMIVGNSPTECVCVEEVSGRDFMTHWNGILVTLKQNIVSLCEFKPENVKIYGYNIK